LIDLDKEFMKHQKISIKISNKKNLILLLKFNNFFNFFFKKFETNLSILLLLIYFPSFKEKNIYI